MTKLVFFLLDVFPNILYTTLPKSQLLSNHQNIPPGLKTARTLWKFWKSLREIQEQ